MLTITAAPIPAQTTSPLEILKHAPKVRIEDDPTPTPRPKAVAPPQQTSIPYVPPSGPAPYVEPAQPAFTPYAGNSTLGAGEPAYPPPAPAYGAPARQLTPTPRPVLGPEDVEPKKKKGGIVRGLIRAIPFVGGDDEEATPTPAPTARSMESRDSIYPPSRTTPAPAYRGYDDPDATASPDSGAPLLLPPGSTPLPADPTPSSPPHMLNSRTPANDMQAPPILTPEPRVPPPIEHSVDLDSAAPKPIGQSQPEISTDPDAPVLTVKRESDSTATETTATGAISNESATPVPPAASAESKIPARATETPEPTPRPLEKATTGVLIQESRPAESVESSSLGPAPDETATIIKPYDPTAPSDTLSDTAADPAANDEITSLTIEQSDLGMPNPAYEQNTTILAEFQQAVRMARSGDHPGAAKAFREYAMNHPSSGLAPRASFLSVIFEKSRSQARENLESLKRLFPKSRYVAEAEKRRSDELAAAPATGAAATPAASVSTAAGAPAEPIVQTETPQQQIARLEKELTAAVGDPAREPELRKRLGLLYLDQEEAGRAYEVLRPAAEMAQGQPLNGEILLALGRTLIARGETVQAISLFEAVEEKHPGLIENSPENAWNAGLAYEGTGNYTKARTLYNLLRQKYPATPEATWATARLNDLAALRR